MARHPRKPAALRSRSHALRARVRCRRPPAASPSARGSLGRAAGRREHRRRSARTRRRAKPTDEIALARQLHAKVVRVEIPWSVIEPRGPGQIDPRALAYTDRLRRSDARRPGSRVIMTVESTPCWASSAPRGAARARARPTRASAANAWPPTEPGRLRRLRGLPGRSATARAWRRSRSGTSPTRPTKRYFAGPDKAARYAAMLRAAYPAIKEADPERAGARAARSSGSNGAFLRALYAAGIKGFYDGLVGPLLQPHARLAALDPRSRSSPTATATPLWLDEFGWTQLLAAPADPAGTGLRDARARRRSTSANTFRALARTPYVAAAVVYKLAGLARRRLRRCCQRARQRASPPSRALARVLSSPLRRDQRGHA